MALLLIVFGKISGFWFICEIYFWEFLGNALKIRFCHRDHMECLFLPGDCAQCDPLYLFAGPPCHTLCKYMMLPTWASGGGRARANQGAWWSAPWFRWSASRYPHPHLDRGPGYRSRRHGCQPSSASLAACAWRSQDNLVCLHLLTIITCQGHISKVLVIS